MGVKGYDCPKDREVYADFMGRPYTFVGKTQMMEVVMTSGDRYRFEWDGDFYARWMEFKMSRYISVFSERSRGIQEQFLLYQLLYPKATKKQLKAFFQLINAGCKYEALKD